MSFDISFEFFPPATDEARTDLLTVARELAGLDPTFVSVTYGAGGSSRDRTLRTLSDLRAEIEVPVAGHLTTVGATRAQTEAVLDAYRTIGVERIVALRGDAPADQPLDPARCGYRTAAELVAAIRERSDGANYHISVAAYPETHPLASSRQADIENLKRKIDAGADQAITQFFFDPDSFLRFRDEARSAGIDAPIIPGIMPIANFTSVRRFAERCGTTIPSWLARVFDGLDDDPEVHQLVAATIAAEQCRRLADEGVTGFHFYTMNRRHLSAATARTLDVTRPLELGSPQR